MDYLNILKNKLNEYNIYYQANIFRTLVKPKQLWLFLSNVFNFLESKRIVIFYYRLVVNI